MKSIFITTIIGPDSRGIIKALANTTRGLDGEWINSKAMKLNGRFTALMKVSIDQEKEALLKETLKSEFPDLEFTYSPVTEEQEKPDKIISLTIDCKDKPGLTKDIIKILSNLDLIIENMEFNRFHVSSIGEAVYSAKLALAVHEETSSEAIAEEIEALSDDVRVNVM